MVQIYTARLSDKRAIRSVLVDEWARLGCERGWCGRVGWCGSVKWSYKGGYTKEKRVAQLELL